MILCRLEKRNGRLYKLSSSGHAVVDTANSGVSLACAAVSTLIRSLGGVLEKSNKIVIGVEKFSPGEVDFTVEHVDKDAEQWLRGLSDMLDQGLEDVQRDFPDQLRIERPHN